MSGGDYEYIRPGGGASGVIGGGGGGAASMGFFSYSQVDPARQLALGHAVDMYRLNAIKAEDVMNTAEEYLAFLRPQPAKPE